MMLPAIQENGPGDIPMRSRFLAVGVLKISMGLIANPFSFSHLSVSTISLKMAMTIGSERLPLAFVCATDKRASS